MEAYLETYYEIVAELEYLKDIGGHQVEVYYSENGSGGMHLLAKRVADAFQEKYKDILWGEDLDWFDTITNFINDFKV